MFISCHELVAAIKDKQKVLLLDMRREQEFNDSHIRDIDCLNVPEDMIYPG